MSYALDIGLLGSDFCTVHHGLMQGILELLEAELGAAADLANLLPAGDGGVRDGGLRGASGCPRHGRPPRGCGRRAASLSALSRADLSAHPVHGGERPGGPRPLADVHRQSRLPGRRSTPAGARDGGRAGGRIVRFEGSARRVGQIREHYDRVADLFDIDPDVVHSWHAGIHPQAFYPLAAGSDINRWGSVAFANPRYAHFHTCGDYAPGEIAWSIFDATIELDGQPYWRTGPLPVSRTAERPPARSGARGSPDAAGTTLGHRAPGRTAFVESRRPRTAQNRGRPSSDPR